uniref:Uncharacterized protein LOC100185949 n=1 Tax=Phallusia mammillata TaxID=59560 RepID=A0A6F9DHN4_9ASCI|nr:uncharacterized protein LOC100185949 [Phallusia mammillata]
MMERTETMSSSVTEVVDFTDQFQSNTTIGSQSTTTSGGESRTGYMDFNITAGVFLILLIAIVTALLLCCCKTYLVCKKRRQQDQGGRANSGTINHPHEGNTEQPPSYEDTMSCAVARTSSTQCAGTFSNISNNQPKNIEDTIAVYWSNDTEEEEPPPVYSCVVITNELALEGNQLPPPPEYETSQNFDASATSPSGYQNNTNRNRFRSLLRSVGSTIRTISYLVSQEATPPSTENVSSNSHNAENSSTVLNASQLQS